MDIRIPEHDGIEVTRRILASPRSRSRINILTTFDLDEYVYDALRAGATGGFLLKDAPPEQPINAIHTGAITESCGRP
jgi:DNA-binding NarL/FixJ family response regulator